MPTTSNFGWTTPADTDLVKDGALAIRTLGNGIDASMAELKGGTTGQVLSKTSNTDMDFTWVTTDDANAIQNAIVDAKGDLIAATANDTPARLAVGSNGQVLIADSAETTGLKWNAPVASLANPIINGGFDIWQRGTSSTNAATTLTYCADRWSYYTNATAANYTISRQSVSDATNLPNLQYAMRVQRDSGKTTTSLLQMSTSIETANSIPFAGKSVTLSFYARCGANFSSSTSIVSVILDQGTGTDQNTINGFTGSSNVGSVNATLTTTWQRFVVTGTVSTSAKELAVSHYYTPTGTAGANDWYEITGLQIDVGTYTASTAPTFRRAGNTVQGELAACQRYYYRTTRAANERFAVGYNSTTTVGKVWINFPVQMRVTPTAFDRTGTAGDYALGYLATAQVCSALPNINNYTPTGAIIEFTVPSGLTAGQGCEGYAQNANAFLGFSAEL